MTRRTAARVAWSLFSLSVAAGRAGLTLGGSGTGAVRPVVPILGFATVEGLVAVRQPASSVAAVHLVSVLVLQLVLRPLTDQPNLAVAASTLAVAVFFRPARAPAQALVNRRFYRRRYDAGRTLESFTGRSRHEVDLDSVSRSLRAGVLNTVQPEHAALWVRTVP